MVDTSEVQAHELSPASARRYPRAAGQPRQIARTTISCPVRLLCLDFSTPALDPRASATTNPATADHVDFTFEHRPDKHAATFLADYRRLLAPRFNVAPTAFAYTHEVHEGELVQPAGTGPTDALHGLEPRLGDVVVWAAQRSPIDLLSKRGWLDGAARLYVMGVSTELVIYLARHASHLCDVHILSDCTVGRDDDSHGRLLHDATQHAWVRTSEAAYGELRRQLEAIIDRRPKPKASQRTPPRPA